MRLDALLFLVRKLYNRNIVLISDDDIQQAQYLGIRGKDKKSEIIYGKVPKSPGSDQLTEVIIKALIPSSSEDAKSRFLKEILVHGNLRHKNLVSLVAFSIDGNRDNFMVKYVNGGSLDDYLSEHENELTLLELVELMLDVAKGLRYLHSKRVLHNDLSADNCLIKIRKRPIIFGKSSRYTVKIGDFGHAKVVSESNGCRFLFDMDPKLPVPVGFAPPEALKRDQLTPASDCYTIGVLFWQILHYGAQPWGHLRNGDEVKKAVCEQTEPLPIPEVLIGRQPQLGDLISRCQSRNPTARPQVEHIITELRQILGVLRTKEQTSIWPMPKLQARPETEEDDAPMQTPTIFESLLKPADDDDDDDDDFGDICPQTAFDQGSHKGSASGMLNKKNNAGNVFGGIDVDAYEESSFEQCQGHGYDQNSRGSTSRTTNNRNTAGNVNTGAEYGTIGYEYATVPTDKRDPELAAPFPASKQKTNRKGNQNFNRLSANQIVFEHELGRGHFGTVRRATIQKEGGYKWMGIHFQSSRQTSKKVAVKTMHTENDRAARLFFQEVLLLEQLRHKNIRQQIGICLDARPIMLVMEMMDGGSLKSYLHNSDTQRTLKPLEILNMLIDIARALCYLVDEGIVHGDISAKNCLLQLKPFTVKLSDFGLAKDIRAMPHQQYYTEKPIFAIAWTAPECFKGTFGLKSDVWSFGVLIWEAFSWVASPFRSCSFQDSCRCQTGVDFPSNRDIQQFVGNERKSLADLPSPCGAFFPDQIKSLMSVCCSFEPKHRPTARQLLTFLKQSRKALAGVPNQYDLIPKGPAQERALPVVDYSDYGYAISSAYAPV